MRWASCSSGPFDICMKCWTMPLTSSTSVAVEGSCPRRCARAGSASQASARISAYSADLVGKCLKSSPSEIAAAAATLLVVVPAKPWRAKHRLAAPRINCRRKSLVMRRVLMLVSKHSPSGKCQETCCDAITKWCQLCLLDRTEAQRAPDARDDETAVATGKHALQIGAVDLDAGKTRPAGNILDRGRKCLNLGRGRDGADIRYPASPGDADEVGSAGCMARLPAGFAVDLIVEHNDGQIAGLLQADGRQTAHSHQHLAIACDHHDRQLGLRQRDPQRDHDRAAHGAPQIKIAVVISRRRDIVG